MDNPTPIPAYSHLIYNCLRLRHSTNINIAHVEGKPVPSRMVHSCVSSARKCLLCPRSFATSSSVRWPGGHHARLRLAGMPAGLEMRGAAALAVSLVIVACWLVAAGPARMQLGRRGWMAGMPTRIWPGREALPK